MSTPALSNPSTPTPTGWYVPVGWRFATALVCGPAALCAFFASFVFGLGIPFLVVAIEAIQRCADAASLRNGTPSEFIFGLAALELAPGFIAVSIIDADGVFFFLPAMITAFVGSGVQRASRPILPPPPPIGRTSPMSTTGR